MNNIALIIERPVVSVIVLFLGLLFFLDLLSTNVFVSLDLDVFALLFHV